MKLGTVKRMLATTLCLSVILTANIMITPEKVSATDDPYTLRCGGLEVGFSEDTGKINSVRLGGIDYFSSDSVQNGFRITDVKTNSVCDASGALSVSGDKLIQNFSDITLGITMSVTYSVKKGGIFVEGTISDTKNIDRLISVEYLTPLKRENMKWYDDIDKFREITENNVFKNAYNMVNNQEMSVYPFSAVSDGINTLAVGVPMDPPLASTVYYEHSASKREAMITRFNVGLSPRTTKIKSKADFSFILYAPKQPEWGLRSAAEDYYNMFPEYFEVRTKEGGNWVFQQNYSNLDGIEDFGIIVNETPIYETDEKNGIYSTPYTAPGEQFIDYSPPAGTTPGYNDFVNHLESMLDSNELDNGFLGLTKGYVANSIKNSALKLSNGNYEIWGYKAYGSSVGFTTNNSPNLPTPNVYSLQMKAIENAVAQTQATGASVDGVYIDNWTGGRQFNYNTAHFAYTDYPLLWDSNEKLAIPLMNTMYEYGKKMRETALQNNWITIGNVVFPDRQGAVKYVHMVDIAGSEVLETEGGGYTLEDQKLRRTLLNQKTWANLLTNTANQPSSLEFKETLMKNSMVYGVFSNVMGYRVDQSVWEDCRCLFRKYTPIAKLTDKLGWEPVTYARYKNQTASVIERFGDFSNDAIVLTMYNNDGTVLSNPVDIDLTRMNVNPVNYSKIMAFDLIKNEIVPVTVNNSILNFERKLDSGDATAVMIGSSDKIFEYIGNLAIADLKRISDSLESIPREYHKYLKTMPEEWNGYVNSLNNLLQFSNDDVNTLFKNGIAVKKALFGLLDQVMNFYSAADIGKTAFNTNAVLTTQRMYDTFSGFFAVPESLPTSFCNAQDREFLENSIPIWVEDFDNAMSIEDAAIKGTTIDFPWYGSMEHHSVSSGENAVNGTKSITVSSPGGLITLSYLNNLNTVFKDDSDYVFTMLLKANGELPQDFEYCIHGMTWRGAPNYFFTIKLALSNGILSLKDVTGDDTLYKKALPRVAVKDMGGGLYSIAMKFTGEKASDGSESMFLRADMSGKASITVDDFKLFSVTEKAKPADFTLPSNPLFSEDFENAVDINSPKISGTDISAVNDASNYFSVTTDSRQVINGGKSLLYRSTVPTELISFGQNLFCTDKNYRLTMSIRDLYKLTDDTAISLEYKSTQNSYFKAGFSYNTESGAFEASVNTDIQYAVQPVAVIDKNSYGDYCISIDFVGKDAAFFSLSFSGKIKCSVDDIVIRDSVPGESFERYSVPQRLTAYTTSSVFSSADDSFNPVYFEDFIPIWTCDFETASGVANASVIGTDVSFAWVGSEYFHSVANKVDQATADAVISGNRSLKVSYPGGTTLNCANLTGAVKLSDSNYYVSTFNIKFLSAIPENFRFNIHAMTWDGSPNYFFTVSLKSSGGKLAAGTVNSDQTIYPLSYRQPECAVKEIDEGTYSIALIFEGAKSSVGTEEMLIRTAVEGDAVEFSLDDFGIYAAASDTIIENMTAKVSTAFYNGFETATAVGINSVTGASMFRALRNPISGVKMNANFSIGDENSAVSGSKSLIYENSQNTKLQNLAFGATDESIIFKQSMNYVSAFDFKSLSAADQSVITVHYRSGGYSATADDYLFSVNLKYSEASHRWMVDTVTKNNNYYRYSVPEVSLQYDGSKYRFGISFVGSKDRGSLEGTFLSLEFDGIMKIALDDIGIYQSAVSEELSRYVALNNLPQIRKGDIDCSGEIDSIDLVLMKKHLLGVQLIKSPDIFKVADIDENNSINIIDMIKLKKLIINF